MITLVYMLTILYTYLALMSLLILLFLLQIIDKILSYKSIMAKVSYKFLVKSLLDYEQNLS